MELMKRNNMIICIDYREITEDLTLKKKKKRF